MSITELALLLTELEYLFVFHYLQKTVPTFDRPTSLLNDLAVIFEGAKYDHRDFSRSVIPLTCKNQVCYFIKSQMTELELYSLFSTVFNSVRLYKTVVTDF